MFYFLLALVINLFVLYSVYQKLLIRINEPERRDKAEMNSIMTEFNRITKNNIDLLEDKIAEIKNLMRILDEKTSRAVKQESRPDAAREGVKAPAEKSLRFAKGEAIGKYHAEGKSPGEISEILGISSAEVELYLNLGKKR